MSAKEEHLEHTYFCEACHKSYNINSMYGYYNGQHICKTCFRGDSVGKI